MAYGFIAFLTGALSVFLILLILVQRGRGGGLAGALGGAGGNSAFGAKAGDLFTKITIVVAGIWFISCIALTISSPTGNGKFDDQDPKYQVEKAGIAATAEDGKEGKENSSNTPPATEKSTPDSDAPDSDAPAAEKKLTEKPAAKSDEKPKKENEKSE